jgi:hypothetical protein
LQNHFTQVAFGELMSGGFPHCYSVILSPDLSMCTMPMSMTIYKVNISLACLQNEIISVIFAHLSNIRQFLFSATTAIFDGRQD